jgi:hypothetical protein
MRLNEFTRGIKVWASNEEQELLARINKPTMINAFEEREQAIIEGLIRKSLLIKVQGQHAIYVYPNV